MLNRPVHMLAALPLSLLLVAGAAAVGKDAAFGAASPRLGDCRLPDVPTPARCGAFDVPENPDRPDGRHLSIAVAVLPAKRMPVRRDPIAFFSGGPGQAAIDSAADIGLDLAATFTDRDILLIDQRGTGRSAPLACTLHAAGDEAASLAHFLPPAAVARCRDELAARADLTQDSFARFADDVEHVRRALSYGRLNLYALSYGTRATQVYLHAYPDSVRTAYLGSVVPIDVPIPLPFARVSQDVLDATIGACESDARCAAAFPALREETRQVFARLADGRVEVPVAGTERPVALDAGRVAERLRFMMYSPAGAADVPWTIHRAHQGDWKPLVDGILESARGFDHQFSAGVFLSITCAEDVRYITDAEVAAATAHTWLGDYRVREQRAACAGWPQATLPPGYRAPVVSSVPTLFVSGDVDPATPKAFADRVAKGFARHADLVLRGQGHSGWTRCAASAHATLVRTGSVEAIDTTCPATPRPPFRISP